jgi:hypothetical protein
VERGDNSAPRASPRASLGHQMALDLVSARFARVGIGDEPRLLVASSPTIVQEALLRLQGPLDIAVESPCAVESTRVLLDADPRWRKTIVQVMQADAILARSPGSYRGVVWDWPHRSSWRQRLSALDTAMSDDGLLAILTSGRLGALLTPFRRGRTADAPQWLQADLKGELARLSFRLDRSYEFCRLECAAYVLMRQLANLVKRPDLADRAEAAYRLSLLDPRGTGPAAFGVLTAHKVGQVR